MNQRLGIVTSLLILVILGTQRVSASGSGSGSSGWSGSDTSSAESSSKPGTPCTVADDCNDRATGVTGTKESGCVCDCVNAYLPPTCAVCPSNYNQDPGGFCSSCAAPYYTDPGLGCPKACSIVFNCSRHASAVVGNAIVGCNCTCNDNFFGQECELCPPQYNPSRCRDCATGYQFRPGTTICDKLCTVQGNCTNHAYGVTGYSGQSCQCDCQEPWVGTQCEICPTGYTGNECEFCAPNYNGWPNCQLCSSAANCSNHAGSVVHGPGTCTCNCRNKWHGDHCELCAAQYNPNGHYDCAACNLPDYPFPNYPNGAYPNCILGCTSRNNCSNHAHSATGNPNISCTCGCRGKWEGNKCQTCPSPYNPAADCSDCLPGRWQYPTCSIAPVTPEPPTPVPTPSPPSSQINDVPSSQEVPSSQATPAPDLPSSQVTPAPAVPSSQQDSQNTGSSASGASSDQSLSKASSEFSLISVSGSSSSAQSSSEASSQSSDSSTSSASSSAASSSSQSSASSSSSDSSASSSSEPKCQPWENQNYTSGCDVCSDPYEWYPFCFYTVHIVGNWSVHFDKKNVDIVKLLENNLMVDLTGDLQHFINTTKERCGVPDEVWAWNSTFIVRDFDVLANTFQFVVDVTSFNAEGTNLTAECLLEQFRNETDFQNITLTNTSKLVHQIAGPAGDLVLGALTVSKTDYEPAHIQELNPCAPDIECAVGTSHMRDWAAALNPDDAPPAEDEAGSGALIGALVGILAVILIAVLAWYFIYYRFKKKNDDAKTARTNYAVERKLDDLEVAFCESEIEHHGKEAGKSVNRFSLGEVYNEPTEMTGVSMGGGSNGAKSPAATNKKPTDASSPIRKEPVVVEDIPVAPIQVRDSRADSIAVAPKQSAPAAAAASSAPVASRADSIIVKPSPDDVEDEFAADADAHDDSEEDGSEIGLDEI